jgi:hypothetical protein
LPKVGAKLHVTEDITLRAAYFETLKQRLHFDQTLEPTTVAGFNQAFQDFNGTEADVVGVGADWRVFPWLFTGVEATWRDLQRPSTAGPDTTQDRSIRGHVSAVLGPYWSLSVEGELTSQEIIRSSVDTLDTLFVPVTARYFHPSGFFASAEMIYFQQDAAGRAGATGSTEGSVLNAGIGFRLPNQRGVISLEVQNLLDRNVTFEDPTFRLGDIGLRRVAPSLTVLGKATVRF